MKLALLEIIRTWVEVLLARMPTPSMRFFRSRRGQLFYVGVLIGLIATVVAAIVMMLVGGSIIGTLETVQAGMNQSTEANSTFVAMTSTTWSSLTMLPVVIIVLVASIIIAAIGAFGTFRR